MPEHALIVESPPAAAIPENDTPASRCDPPPHSGDASPPDSALLYAGAAALRRILLRTDGTLTDLVEAVADEPVHVVRLEHRTGTAATAVAALELGVGEPLIDRRIVLRGRHSRVTYLYAEVRIAAARMPAPLRRALETSDVPLGHLVGRHRLELYREPPTCRWSRAAHLGTILQADPRERVATRCYRMILGGRPMASIREYLAPALWSPRPQAAGRERALAFWI